MQLLFSVSPPLPLPLLQPLPPFLLFPLLLGLFLERNLINKVPQCLKAHPLKEKAVCSLPTLLQTALKGAQIRF